MDDSSQKRPLAHWLLFYGTLAVFIAAWIVFINQGQRGLIPGAIMLVSLAVAIAGRIWFRPKSR